MSFCIAQGQSLATSNVASTARSYRAKPCHLERRKELPCQALPPPQATRRDSDVLTSFRLQAHKKRASPAGKRLSSNKLNVTPTVPRKTGAGTREARREPPNHPPRSKPDSNLESAPPPVLIQRFRAPSGQPEFKKQNAAHERRAQCTACKVPQFMRRWH